MAWPQPNVQLRLTHVKYLGGWPDWEDPKDGMVLEFKQDGLSVKMFKEKLFLPYVEITGIVVEGAEQAEKRVTATRLLAIGVFALAAQKGTGEAFMEIQAGDKSAMFMVPKMSAGELRGKVAQWTPKASTPPPPPAPPAAPAGWMADPHGRHELRYWDGKAWSDNVSDLGVQSTDAV